MMHYGSSICRRLLPPVYGSMRIRTANSLAASHTVCSLYYDFFSFPDGLRHVEEIKLSNCIYIQDECLQRISETESLQKSLLRLMISSCGNVTDKGIIALHKLT